jgi:type I restriction enzyme, S subunit
MRVNLVKYLLRWSAQPIEAIADKVAMGPFGSNIKVETFVESGVPIISGNHLRGLYLDELEYNFITEEHARRTRRLANSLVRAGDIIFTHAGNIGLSIMG